jgi:hypothetical protein
MSPDYRDTPPPSPSSTPVLQKLEEWHADFAEADARRNPPGIRLGPIILTGQIQLGQIMQALVILGSAISAIFTAGAYSQRLLDRLALAEARVATVTVKQDERIVSKLEELHTTAKETTQAAQETAQATKEAAAVVTGKP